MFFKKKITIEFFVKEHFLLLINEMMESEFDLFQKDIYENSNIQIEKNESSQGRSLRKKMRM